MQMKRVPLMQLRSGYYEILSDSQKQDLSNAMQIMYETGRPAPGYENDDRVFWYEVEAGGPADGWCIMIPWIGSVTNYSEPEDWP